MFMKLETRLKNKIRNQKGISLLETLVYLGLFLVIFVTIMQFLFIISENNLVARQRNELQKSVIFLTEHLDISVQNADSVDSLNSTFTSDDGALQLVTNGGVEYQNYSITGGRIQFDNNGDLTFLTPPEYTVTKLFLEEVHDVNAVVIGVKTTIELRATKKTSVNETIETIFLLD